MPKYAEVVYETGNHATLSYEKDDLSDLMAGLKAQHDRAINGVTGGPGGHPAERIKQVFLYDDDPGEYTSSSLVTVEDLQAIIDDLNVGGQVSVNQLHEKLRAFNTALVVPAPEHPHDSIFIAPETKVVKEGWE